MARVVKEGLTPDPNASAAIRTTVSEILLAIEREGLPAVRRYSEKFDGWSPEHFVVGAATVSAASEQVSQDLQSAIAFACDQVRQFAQRQRGAILNLETEILPGVVLGHRQVPVGRVGSYSPGGRYPLIASSIMTIATPKVAGVGNVIAAAPPRDGRGIHPPQLFAMAHSGADRILCLGGVQALAVMAFGLPSEDLEPVDMVVGAGNAYVAEAKRQLFGRVGIDLLAGPSEIAVIADDSADPRLVAADILAQAEHGVDSPATLLTTSDFMANKVIEEIAKWLGGDWPTKEIAGQSWQKCGRVIVCDDPGEVVSYCDQLAPEHLEVQVSNPDWYFANLTNYGSIFLGSDATVAYSDKTIGTNHVLPTGGAARYTGGLSVGKFLKTLTYQRILNPGAALDINRATSTIATAELMFGHSLSAELRLPKILASASHSELNGRFPA